MRLITLKINLTLTLVFLFISLYSQSDDYADQVATKKTRIGLTIGTLPTIYSGFEFSLPMARQINDKWLLEYRPLTGVLYQNEGKHLALYGGGSVNLSVGKKSGRFESGLGLAYFFDPSSEWGELSNHLLPIVNLAYRKSLKKQILRVGIGFPNGLYLSVYY